jgi:hypothetical protein
LISRTVVVFAVLAVGVCSFADRADYVIHAVYNETAGWVDMDVVVSYTSSGLIPVDTLWFYLEPNNYSSRETEWSRLREREVDREAYFASDEERGGLDLTGVWSGNRRLEWSKEGDGTVAWVALPEELFDGESVDVRVIARLIVPRVFEVLGRNDRVLQLVRWYPRVASLDATGRPPLDESLAADVTTVSGDYDVNFVLPDNLLAVSSGTRVGTFHNDDGTKRVRWVATDVSDFAVVALDGYAIIGDSSDPHVSACASSRESAERLHRAARSAVDSFSTWFGQSSSTALTVVQGEVGHGWGSYADGVVIVDAPSSIGHFVELTVAEQAAHGWFRPVPDEPAGASIHRSLARYAAQRWMSSVYGERDNLLNLPAPLRSFWSLSAREFDRGMMAYAEVRKAGWNSGEEYEYDPLAEYARVLRGSFALSGLQCAIGNQSFDSSVRRYSESGSDCTYEGFSASLESNSYSEVADYLDFFFGSDDVFDLGLHGSQSPADTELVFGAGDGRTVHVDNPSHLSVRVPFSVRDGRGGEHRTYLDVPSDGLTVRVSAAGGVSALALDPDGSTPDINLFNNRLPRRVSIELFAPRLPRTDSYQISTFPYAWYSSGADEFTFGAYVFGRRFLGVPSFGGDHLVVGSSMYSTGWEKLGLSLEYTMGLSGSTPGVELSVGGLWWWDKHSVSVAFSRSVPAPYPDGRWRRIAFSTELSGLFGLENYDPDAYEEARVSAVSISGSTGRETVTSWNKTDWRARYVAELDGTRAGVRFDAAHEMLWYYGASAYFGLRGFFGLSAGELPSQEQFQLYGSLSTGGMPMASSGTSLLGTTRRWHTFGDASLRGYSGRGIYGPQCYAVNGVLKFPSIPVSLFVDAGAVNSKPLTMKTRDLFFDAGAGLMLGPLRAQFPFWVSDPEEGESEFDLRWLVGFNARF